VIDFQCIKEIRALSDVKQTDFNMGERVMGDTLMRNNYVITFVCVFENFKGKCVFFVYSAGVSFCSAAFHGVNTAHSTVFCKPNQSVTTCVINQSCENFTMENIFCSTPIFAFVKHLSLLLYA